MEASGSQAPASTSAAAPAAPAAGASNGVHTPSGGTPAMLPSGKCLFVSYTGRRACNRTALVTPRRQRNNQICCPHNADRLPNLCTELRTLFSAALEQAYPGVGIAPVIAQCNNPKFGDYQCNNAMALFAQLKGKVGAAPPLPQMPDAIHVSTSLPCDGQCMLVFFRSTAGCSTAAVLSYQLPAVRFGALHAHIHPGAW